jgi:hypothetical protein
MGITIHYRGRMADLERVEDFEDRVLDLALELGGMARIWRSAADDNPRRVVRGVVLNLAPGQETTSLLISPEGWLVPLMQIEDAEAGRLTEPPWCFVKTQFGPLEGHVALVEVLTALRREFLPDLEVHDEGEYWETRDFAKLAKRFGQVQAMIDGLAEGLRRNRLSAEAAEDMEIVLKRIERVAAQVHRALRRPSEHPPVTFDDDDVVPDPEKAEAHWDEMFRHNRRQQERMHRAIEERMRRGEDHEQAFENAMRDIGIPVPGDEPLAGEDDEDADADWLEDEGDWADEAADSDEDWLKDAEDDKTEESGASAADDELDPDRKDRHPLLQRSMDLLHRLHDEFEDADPSLESTLQTLFHGAGDMMGGLAQSLSSYGREDEEDFDDYGLRVTQLKRALRGAAFAHGALYPLRTGEQKAKVDELQNLIADMERDIFAQLSELRSKYRRPEGE